MKLYYSPGSSSLAAHIVLREAGVPVDLVRVDLKTHLLPDGSDYCALNPKGYVPMLELDDGRRLTEIPAIVQYVADQRPQTRLAPVAGDFERYRLQEWLNFVSTELHKGFSALFNPAASDEWKNAARGRLEARFDWLAGQLSQRSFLMGEQFTAADACLFTVLSWGRHVKFDISRWPVLASYAARIGQRPAVQEALRAEGLLKS